MSTLDLWASECLVPLALWVLVSGLDDLCVDLRFLLWKIRTRGQAPDDEAQPTSGYPSEKRIAIYIPCWDESAVIRKMLDRNLATIEYENYDIWLGLYPTIRQHLRLSNAARSVRRESITSCAEIPARRPKPTV